MRTLPVPRWMIASAALLAAFAVATACGDDSGSGPNSQAARIELTVAPHHAVTGDRLEARAFYRRSGTTEQVTLATRDLALSGAEQQLSVPVELRDCLRDGRRVGGGSTCVVDIALSLRAAGGEVLQSDTVRNVSLAPNDVYRVAQPVLLERPEGVPLVAFTDPANDTLPMSELGLPRAADARSVAISAKRDSLVVTLRFGGPIAQTTPVGFLEIDADENPETGPMAIMDVFGASSGLGVDYAILFDTSFPLTVDVFATESEQLTELPAEVRGDVLVIRVPLSRIGGDGNFAFGGIIGTFDRPTDWFPNTGVYTVRAGPTPAASRAAASRAAGGTRPGRGGRPYAEGWRWAR